MPGTIDKHHSSADSEDSEKAGGSQSILENLPAELRAKILRNIPDLETLRTIIQASPTMYAQYKYDSHRILSDCLDRELDGFVVDAYATLMSRPIGMGSPRTKGWIKDFLNTYKCWLAAPESCVRVKELSPDQVRWIAGFHVSVVRPLIRQWEACDRRDFLEYIWIWDGCDREDHEDHIVPQGYFIPWVQTRCHRVVQDRYINELSGREELRIRQALYRHKTHYHLFGHTMSNPNDVDRLFLHLFKHWEIAVMCFAM
ncbi:hypothetical protein F5B22DRAFT_583198 [Xylaria bambusicola]|uniref:uncharacterized protein n=1 Tax=Xylaria bambusicola TaxID=326684 RepID=UPI002007C903|nr:uncharacterized protein F5B22DRAFT_583198 [Xylaria bambusicola]KAI0527992.1 hypothetical protein F5B22DRAFT_583198 [Xylaria bambusicola]